MISERKSTLIDRVNSFTKLKLDWDGYGALPIYYEAIRGMIKLIELLEDNTLSLGMTYPNTDGNVTIFWRLTEENHFEVMAKPNDTYEIFHYKEGIILRDVTLNLSDVILLIKEVIKGE